MFCISSVCYCPSLAVAIASTVINDQKYTARFHLCSLWVLLAIVSSSQIKYNDCSSSRLSREGCSLHLGVQVWNSSSETPQSFCTHLLKGCFKNLQLQITMRLLYFIVHREVCKSWSPTVASSPAAVLTACLHHVARTDKLLPVPTFSFTLLSNRKLKLRKFLFFHRVVE